MLCEKAVNPKTEDKLEAQVDELNQDNRYAVKIIKNGLTVGHIPSEILKIHTLLFHERRWTKNS